MISVVSIIFFYDFVIATFADKMETVLLIFGIRLILITKNNTLVATIQSKYGVLVVSTTEVGSIKTVSSILKSSLRMISGVSGEI